MRAPARAAAPVRALLEHTWAARAYAAAPAGSSAAAASASAASAGAPPPPPPPPAPAMRVLVTGAAGQIGSDLVPFLARRLAPGAVLATDVRPPSATAAAAAASAAAAAATPPPLFHWAALDCTDAAALLRAAEQHRATHVLHLAALLSARCEQDPDLALAVNCRGTEAALSVARRTGAALLLPSTIGVYGFPLEEEEEEGGGGRAADPSSSSRRALPCSDAPSADPGRPHTLYGVTKAYAEGLGAWYGRRHGVDFRALRLPGVLSAVPPGGGTTDYALHMLESAVEAVEVAAAAAAAAAAANRGGRGGQQQQLQQQQPPYSCFVGERVALPFMHASDTLEAVWRLLVAPRACLSRSVYNVGAVTATPADWRAALERAAAQELAEASCCASSSSSQAPPPLLLRVTYAPDHRDAIARSWPAALDCSAAARDWGYAPRVASVDAMARRLVRERLLARGRLRGGAAVAPVAAVAAAVAEAAAAAPRVAVAVAA